MSRVIKVDRALDDQRSSLTSAIDLMPQLRRAPAVDCETLARDRAEAILAEARNEAESVRRQAHAEGYEAGLAQAAARSQSLIQRLEDDLADLQRERAALAQSVEQDLLKLCVQLVEKIIRHEVRTDQRVVTRAIRSCLLRVSDGSAVTVRVNPAELDYVRQQREELMAGSELVRELNLVSDRRVSSGGCVVETPSGCIDARVETQIEQLGKKLMEKLEDDRRKTDSEPGQIPGGGETG